MNEIQKAMQSLYTACKAQHSSSDSCFNCPLFDKDAISDDEGSFCLANHPCVWDAFHPWLREG
jgi:hypothetical protein